MSLFIFFSFCENYCTLSTSLHNISELLVNPLRLNWTQNVVIMEAELAAESSAWYIDEALRCDPTKAELLELLSSEAHLQISLDQS